MNHGGAHRLAEDLKAVPGVRLQLSQVGLVRQNRQL